MLNFSMHLQMQPTFALSLQANSLTNANPLARTPMTVQKKVARDSMIGGIVDFPSSEVLGAHGFARLFQSTRFKGTAIDKFVENFETVITFERDTFIETVMKLMKEFPDIPMYRIEDDKVEFLCFRSLRVVSLFYCFVVVVVYVFCFSLNGILHQLLQIHIHYLEMFIQVTENLKQKEHYVNYMNLLFYQIIWQINLIQNCMLPY